MIRRFKEIREAHEEKREYNLPYMMCCKKEVKSINEIYSWLLHNLPHNNKGDQAIYYHEIKQILEEYKRNNKIYNLQEVLENYKKSVINQ